MEASGKLFDRQQLMSFHELQYLRWFVMGEDGKIWVGISSMEKNGTIFFHPLRGANQASVVSVTSYSIPWARRKSWSNFTCFLRRSLHLKSSLSSPQYLSLIASVCQECPSRSFISSAKMAFARRASRRAAPAAKQQFLHLLDLIERRQLALADFLVQHSPCDHFLLVVVTDKPPNNFERFKAKLVEPLTAVVKPAGVFLNFPGFGVVLSNLLDFAGDLSHFLNQSGSFRDSLHPGQSEGRLNRVLSLQLLESLVLLKGFKGITWRGSVVGHAISR